MSLLSASDALQVAMVRLRLENVPCRMVTRADYPIGWPCEQGRVVIFIRTTMTPLDYHGPAMMVDVSPGYVTDDGVERVLHNASALHIEAMKLGGYWMASGWNG